MKIVFIGAGNLATRLAIELYKHNHTIVQIYSRTIESAQGLADKFSCSATQNIESVVSDADLYVFSVKDSALLSIIEKMNPNKGIWIHTAGSIPLTIFENHHPNYGVVYPFQTFSRDRYVDFKKIPVFLEANSSHTLDTLNNLFHSISDSVMELNSDKRMYLHLTGVFACNFVNHMYALSQDILDKQDIPFSVIRPLIDETAAKIHELLPAEAQTGPAVRFDENIINKHISLIENQKVKELYRLITESIHDKYKNDNIK